MPSKREKSSSVKLPSEAPDSSSSSTAQQQQNSGAPPSGGKWELNQKVLCRYLNSDNIWYEAKIIGVGAKNGESLYTVHYQGWNSRHDERIGETEAAERFKNYTDEEAEKAKENLKKAQQDLSKKKRKSGLDPKKSAGGGDDSSRASTPSVRSSTTDMPPSKRGKTDADGAAYKGDREEIRKIELPEPLKKILTDDNNMINKQQMLPKIPARVTVAEIIQQYRDSLGIKENKSSSAAAGNGDKEFYIEYSESEEALLNPSPDSCEQSALGLLDYFDMTIGSLLLYKFERPLYSDLYAAESSKLGQKEEDADKEEDLTYGRRSKIRLSHHFGLPHLLRLFVRFTDMLQFTQWSSRALDAIVRHAQDFIMFLSKHHQDYYNVDQDYEVAAPEYLKRVWGGTNQ